MPRTVEIEPERVVIRLSGWTMLAALKREVVVPRRAIRRVATGPWVEDGWRVAGSAIPWTDYRQGRFRSHGRKVFLSFEDRHRVVVLEVDRDSVGFDIVVVGVDDPETVAAELRA